MKDTKTGTYQAKVYLCDTEYGMREIVVMTEAVTRTQAEKELREFVRKEAPGETFVLLTPYEIAEDIHGRMILNGMRDWFDNLILDMNTPIEDIKTTKKYFESAETVNTHELARIAEIYKDAMNYSDLVKVVCKYASSIGKDDD